MEQLEMASEKKVRMAIFASGTGTNAYELIKYFSGHPRVEIVLIVSNKQHSGVLSVAKEAGVDTLVVTKDIFNSEEFLPVLENHKISFIILAGFLLKVPGYLINAFQNSIINIHPALLPLYGGKGMYGSHVHKAVIANRDERSGITIHLADNEYDHGLTLFQASCKINNGDEEGLIHDIHRLEHEHFAPVVEAYITRYK